MNIKVVLGRVQSRAPLMAFAYFIVLGPPALGQQVTNPCQRGELLLCSKHVTDELHKRSAHFMAHPIEAYELAAQWDRLFQERYLALEGQPRTKTDVDKILEELKSKVDPVEYAKDKAIDSAVKKWFKRLAPMMAFLSSAPAVAVRVFLEPSEIMNPLSELQQKNREVRDAVWKVTSTMLYADAKTRYTNMLMQLPAPTGPQIKRP